MAKEFYCATCGVLVETKMKALPKVGKVINVIYPHTCRDDVVGELDELIANNQPKPTPEPAGANFPFIERLNREMGKLETPTFKSAREERDVSSTAPGGLSNLLLSKGKLQSDPRETEASNSNEPEPYDGGVEMGD